MTNLFRNIYRNAWPHNESLETFKTVSIYMQSLICLDNETCLSTFLNLDTTKRYIVRHFLDQLLEDVFLIRLFEVGMPTLNEGDTFDVCQIRRSKAKAKLYFPIAFVSLKGVNPSGPSPLLPPLFLHSCMDNRTRFVWSSNVNWRLEGSHDSFLRS